MSGTDEAIEAAGADGYEEGYRDGLDQGAANRSMELMPELRRLRKVEAAAREFAEAWRGHDFGVQVYAEALCEALGVEP